MTLLQGLKTGLGINVSSQSFAVRTALGEGCYQ
jgi:hypothetical protein